MVGKYEISCMMTLSVIILPVTHAHDIDLPDSQLAALRELEQRRKLSRAELIRNLLWAQLRPMPMRAQGGLDSIVGSLDIEPFDIDEAVYGPRG